MMMMMVMNCVFICHLYVRSLHCPSLLYAPGCEPIRFHKSQWLCAHTTEHMTHTPNIWLKPPFHSINVSQIRNIDWCMRCCSDYKTAYMWWCTSWVHLVHVALVILYNRHTTPASVAIRKSDYFEFSRSNDVASRVTLSRMKMF